MKSNFLTRPLKRQMRKLQRTVDNICFLICIGAAVIIGLYLFFTQVLPDSISTVIANPRGAASLVTPILILAAVVVLACFVPRWIRKKAQEKKYQDCSMLKIDAMEGKEFEQYLASQFSKLGYQVELTPDNNDYGADLILSKGRQRTVVQVKRYKDKVNNSAVQEAVAAKKVYGAKHAMVVTNSYFTQNAKTLARKNSVELWDRDMLVKRFQPGRYD